MSRPDPALTGQRREVSLAAAEARFDQGRRAYDSLLERLTPWLCELGRGICGGFIAFTLLIVPPLMTVRPVDRPITIATAAVALALPLDVTGLVLLRIVREVKPAGFEDELARAFQQAGLQWGERQIPSLAPLEAVRRRGTRNVLHTALGILTLSSVLTLAGTGAALGQVARWPGGPVDRGRLRRDGLPLSPHCPDGDGHVAAAHLGGGEGAAAPAP